MTVNIVIAILIALYHATDYCLPLLVFPDARYIAFWDACLLICNGATDDLAVPSTLQERTYIHTGLVLVWLPFIVVTG